MAEKILIEYQVQIDGMKAQLKSVEASLKSVEDKAKESAQGASKHFGKASDEIKNIGKEIAMSLGIAFGVAKVIDFGKESVKAFMEAEVNANKLRFAVTRMGGEGEAAFRKLIEQSAKLQSISIFSDDDIQRAQTQLITLGLNSTEVENLIPKILDLASATGQDLGSATQSIIQGINGQTRGLKAVGLEFDATGDKTQNLAILTEKLNKFYGASAEALETVAGKTKRFENAIDDIKESIGEMIVENGTNLLDFFDMFSQGIDKVATRRAKGIMVDAFAKENDKILANAKKSEADRLRIIDESNKKIVALGKLGLEEVVDNETGNFRRRTIEEREFILLKLKNEQALNKELQGLNDKKTNRLGIDEDAKKEAAKNALKIEQDRIKKSGNEWLAEVALKEKNDEILLGNAESKAEAEAKIDADAIKKSGNEWLDEIAFKEKNDEIEIANAEEKAKALLEIEKKLSDEKQAIQQASIDFIIAGLSAVSQISSNLAQTEINNINSVADNEIKSLDSQLKNKLISQEQYDKKKDAINEAARKKESDIKRKQFELEKQIAMIQVIINTAKAITQAGIIVPLQILAAVTGAIQLAVIASQPTPKFAKGVVGLKGAGTGTSDSIHAMLSKNESVVTSEATTVHRALLEAMNKNQGQKYIYDFYIAPALKAQLKKNAEFKDSSFASNIAHSLALHGTLKDGNLLESLKQSRKSDRENAIFIAKAIASQNQNKRNW